MKKNKHVISLVSILFILVSCSNSNDTMLHFADNTDSGLLLRINKSLFDDLRNPNHNSNGTSNGDFFEINEMKRVGDIISINVSYSGGCQEHDFEIIWDGIAYTDNPCFMNILLLHNANDDLCEAYITETISFDVNELIGGNNEIKPCGFNLFKSYNKSNIPDEIIEGLN